MILLDAEAHTVETHVKGFGALPEHVASEDVVGGCAVCFNWGGWLRVAHFDEGRVDGR